MACSFLARKEKKPENLWIATKKSNFATVLGVA